MAVLWCRVRRRCRPSDVPSFEASTVRLSPICRHWSVCVAAAALLFGACAEPQGGAPAAADRREARSVPRVVLEERSALVVPEFSDALPLGDSAFLLWHRARPEFSLVTTSGHVAPSIALPAAPIAVAPSDSSGTFEMLDAGGRLYRLTLDGRVLSIHRLPLTDTLTAALSRSDTWWIVTIDPRRSLRLTQYMDTRPALSVTLAMARSDSVLQLWNGGLHLIESPIGFALLTARAPFELTSLTEAGHTSSSLRLGEAPELAVHLRPHAPRRPADFPPDWRALSPVVLDSLLLVTIADVNSDRRLLALVHLRDGVRRVTELNVPIGLIGIGSQGEILAARRTDQFELVRYGWKWATAINPTRR